MSLTSRMKSAGIKRHTARDGTTYVLQRVNDANPFLQSGMLPAVLEMIEGDQDPNELSKGEIMRRLTKNPKHAEEAIRIGSESAIRKLEQGLVGEVNDRGEVDRYVFVDKPLYELADLEVNARLIDSELSDELIEVIDGLGRPAAEAPAIRRFPQDGPSDLVGAAGDGDRHAPQRGPVGG